MTLPIDAAPTPWSAGAADPHWTRTASPESKGDRTRFLIFVWVLAVLLAGFLALLAYNTGSGGEARRAGYAVGSFVAPFLLALILRFIWARVIRRSATARPPVLRSRWVPLGAIVLMGVNFAGNVGSFVPPAPVDANSAVRISAPFTLREASSDTALSFKGIESFRWYAVREVVGNDGSVSLLVVADGAMRDREGAIEETALGMEDASGLTPTIESINGRKVAIAAGDTLVFASWIEEPLLFSVYAADRPTLDAIVRAVMTAPRT